MIDELPEQAAGRVIRQHDFPAAAAGHDAVERRGIEVALLFVGVVAIEAAVLEDGKNVVVERDLCDVRRECIAADERG
jgi:hypothetical protein